MKLKTQLFYSHFTRFFNYFITPYNFCWNSASFISQDRLSLSPINLVNAFNVNLKSSKYKASKFDGQLKSMSFSRKES